MPRYARNSAILAKIETTVGTDSVPTGAANAVLVSNISVNPLNATNIPRDLVRNYFGASEHLVGTAFVEIEFDVEFQSSGSIATPTIPAWDALLQGCTFAAGVGTVASRIEYAFATDYSTWKTLTIHYHDDGLRHVLLGARGTMTVNLKVGERPFYHFKFVGQDGGASAVANPATTLTGFMTPLAVTDPNTGALTLGCTYATGALSGGVEYVSAGLELDLGNDVQFIDLLGTAALAGQAVDVAGRDITGKITFDLTAANEAAFLTSVKANTTQSLGLVHGSAAGLKMLVFAPKVQMLNPRKEDKTGRRLVGFDLRLLPSATTGNDELRIVAI